MGTSGSTRPAWRRHRSLTPTTPSASPTPRVIADSPRRSMHRGPASPWSSRMTRTSSVRIGIPAIAIEARSELFPAPLGPRTAHARPCITNAPAWKLCRPCHLATTLAVDARCGWTTSRSVGSDGRWSVALLLRRSTSTQPVGCDQTRARRSSRYSSGRPSPNRRWTCQSTQLRGPGISKSDAPSRSGRQRPYAPSRACPPARSGLGLDSKLSGRTLLRNPCYEVAARHRAGGLRSPARATVRYALISWEPLNQVGPTRERVTRRSSLTRAGGYGARLRAR